MRPIIDGIEKSNSAYHSSAGRMHMLASICWTSRFPSPVASFDDNGEEPTTMVSLTREIPERHQGGSKVASMPQHE